MSDASGSYEKKSIVFENGRSAQIIQINPSIIPANQASQLLEALDCKSAGASFLICGSTKPFESRLRNRLIDLLSRGMGQAALDRNAIIFDEGTRNGVSELVGQSIADRGRKTKLIGVHSPVQVVDSENPSAEVATLDPNHTFFVEANSGQGSLKADFMCQLAEAIEYISPKAKDAKSEKKRIVTLLVGGELQGSALDITLETVRKGWPLLVFEGSGPLADKIIKYKKYQTQQLLQNRSRRFGKWFRHLFGLDQMANLQETDPRTYEIVNDGKITIIEDDVEADQLRKLINGVLAESHKEDVLWAAWQRFAEYDLNSSRHRVLWRRLKNIPLFLGIVSTLIVLIYSATDTNILVEGAQNSIWVNTYAAFMDWLSGIRNIEWLDLIFRFTIILLPITTSLILSLETRYKPGSKYILLRGAAEAIKRGIYSYRTLRDEKEKEEENKEKVEPNPKATKEPANDRLVDTEHKLAEHLAKVSKFLLESDVNEAAFKPYEGHIPPKMYGASADDDGFSKMDPDSYVNTRIGGQLTFYTSRTNQYEKSIRRWQIWMLISGAIGTFLAAIGAQYWLPFTAAIVSAGTAFLEYQQLEQILTKYNLTKASLENIKANWLALQANEVTEEQRKNNIRFLVQEVEATLEGENQGWVQYVSQAQEHKKDDLANEVEQTHDNGDSNG